MRFELKRLALVFSRPQEAICARPLPRYRSAVEVGAGVFAGVPRTRMYRLQPVQSSISKPSRSSAGVTTYASPQRHSYEKQPPSASSKSISSTFTFGRLARCIVRRFTKPRRGIAAVWFSYVYGSGLFWMHVTIRELQCCSQKCGWQVCQDKSTMIYS